MLLLPPRRCVFPVPAISGGHAAFAIRLLARPTGISHLRGYLCIHSRCGLMTCWSPCDPFVGGLHDVHLFPPCRLATGLRLLPRWDLHPLDTSTFAGRTTGRDTLASSGSYYPLHPWLSLPRMFCLTPLIPPACAVSRWDS